MIKRVIIDTDPGIDDAAIFLTLASPELSVEAITTVYGNGPVDLCADNALRILDAAGHVDVPVYRGLANLFCATLASPGLLRYTALMPWATLTFLCQRTHLRSSAAVTLP